MEEKAKLLAEILCVITTTEHTMDNTTYKYDKGIPFDEWMYALNVELEHGTTDKYTDVTGDNLLKTARIALAHIREYPNYYKGLKAMEAELETQKEKYKDAKIVVTKGCPTSNRLQQELRYLKMECPKSGVKKTDLVWLPHRTILIGGRRMESEIQSILFDKNKWTIPKAKKWLKKHDYKYDDVRTTTNKIRFRQVEPNQFQEFRTLAFSDKYGVEAILGLKTEKKKRR